MDITTINHIPHPALSMEYDSLYEGLMKQTEKGLIKRAEFEDLILFNYTQKCTFVKGWNIFTLVARGLILSPSEKKIVALPFPKFFNFSELPTETRENILFSTVIDDITTTEKMDGSLGIIFYHTAAKKWRVATRGSFKSKQALWAMEWIEKNNVAEQLSEDITYLAEIIYPENKIVIKYDFEGLVFLGAYHRENGIEIPIPDNLTKAKEYPLSLDRVLEMHKTLPGTQEGFVVKLNNGIRLKIKGEEYLRLHQAREGCTKLKVWTALKNGDNLDAMKETLPEEYYNLFDEYRRDFEGKYKEVSFELIDLISDSADLSDKELGRSSKFDKNEKRLIFEYRKRNGISQTLREKIFLLFKPKE